MDPQILKKARTHLMRKDDVLKQLIKATGPCTLRSETDHFAILTRSIISQQISTKAALAIGNRLLASVKRFRPKNILAATDESMRAAGLSMSKVLSLRDLAAKCADGTINLKKLPTMADADIIEALVKVRGIGPWTADMFLIFSLGRLDILPLGDYGLRAGLQRHYALDALPNKAAMIEMTAAWQPYRSIGTWYIWRSFGFVPQSETA
jgi:DNA-3-methyladenine glycosylase II